MTEKELVRLLQSNPDLSAEGFDVPSPSAVVQAAIASERDLHIAIVAEIDRRAFLDPVWGLIFHPANGEYRDKATAGRLKAMGVRRGVLDFWWPIARHGYRSLALEIKHENGKLTQEQRWWIEQLQAQGWWAGATWGYEDTMRLLEWYVEG